MREYFENIIFRRPWDRVYFLLTVLIVRPTNMQKVKNAELSAMVAEEILWIKTIGRSNKSYVFQKSQ